MQDKIKVSAVSYLNSKPLLYGIERSPILNKIDLSVDYPAIIAKKLQDNTTDIGLVSVAAILTIPNAQIIGDYCIAADQEVASVCIFSLQPLEKIKKIYLDYQSRTSVKLAEILIKKFWKYDIELLDAPEDYIELIDQETAAVIIGDRALAARNNFPYIYDLAKYWIEFTGYDMVFAAWVANKSLPQSFIDEFNDANEIGLHHLPEIIETEQYKPYDLNIYYNQNIKYKLDDNKRAGLALFLKYIKEL